jgi:hypothetical protein
MPWICRYYIPQIRISILHPSQVQSRYEFCVTIRRLVGVSDIGSVGNLNMNEQRDDLTHYNVAFLSYLAKICFWSPRVTSTSSVVVTKAALLLSAYLVKLSKA